MSKKPPDTYGFLKGKVARTLSRAFIHLRREVSQRLRWFDRRTFKPILFFLNRPLWRLTFFCQLHQRDILCLIVALYTTIFLFGYTYPKMLHKKAADDLQKIVREGVGVDKGRPPRSQEDIFKMSEMTRYIKKLEERIEKLEKEITARDRRVTRYCRKTRNPGVCFEIARAGKFTERDTGLTGLTAFALALGRSEQNYNCPSFNCFGLGATGNGVFMHFKSHRHAVVYLGELLTKRGYDQVNLTDIESISRWYKGKPPYDHWIALIQETMARITGEAFGGTTQTIGYGYPVGDCKSVSLVRPVSNWTLIRGFSGWHPALDLAGSYGTPISATSIGTIASAGWHGGGYGYSVFLNIGGGWQIRFAHLSRISVRTGQFVPKSAKIGEMGMTGNASGAHLHLELLCSGEKVNPLKYIK